MSGDETVLVVEFKLVLARTLETYLLEQLASAARAQRRRLPAVASTLVRSGALESVAQLDAASLRRFAAGRTWADAFRRAVEDGSWERLVQDALRHALPPSST